MAVKNGNTATNKIGDKLDNEVKANPAPYDQYADFSPEYIAAREAVDACATQQELHQLLRPVLRSSGEDMAKTIAKSKKAIDEDKVGGKKARLSLRRAFRRKTA